MTPEAKARQQIDQKLLQTGWLIQDLKQLNLGAAQGIAVREYPTDTGLADYVLFVNRQAVGVIEAKRDEAAENITTVENQTARYAHAKLKWRKDDTPLPFLFESTSQIIRFTDERDPAPRSREIFHFYKPEQLINWLNQPDTLRHRLYQQMPELPTRNLRDCQINAVTGLEKSLANNKPRALVHMATGAGKTFTAITSVYRLLKFGGAKRILFLVDTRNLGKQAHQEFMAYSPPDDARKFTELYNVQRLASNSIDPHAQVCISTIQRMYSILSGEAIDDSAEDLSLNELQQTSNQAKLVRYNPAVPIESFDFIVIDECHRSIYNLWKQVLDYFDAFLIGLTATPDKRTFGFFNENIVAEYSYEQSVADGVNVGYDVYEIVTEITQKGSILKAKEWIDHRDRQTRKKRWAETEDKYPEPVKPDTRNFTELPEGWVWASVDQLTIEQKYGSSSKTNEDVNGVPVLRMGNIQDGDLLFNRTNSPELVGKTAVYRSERVPCSYASYLISVRFSESSVPELAASYINSAYGKHWIKSVVIQQVGQANVNGTKLSALAIPLPPFVEQKEIISLLQTQTLEIFEQLKNVDMSLKQSAAQRKNILKSAFSGQLVPQDPNDEPASVLLQRIRNERQQAKIPAKRSRRRAGEELSP